MNAPNLDDLLTADEAAQWLRISKRELSRKSKGRNPEIPSVRINQKVTRWHPRTILAKFAARFLTSEALSAAFNGVQLPTAR